MSILSLVTKQCNHHEMYLLKGAHIDTLTIGVYKIFDLEGQLQNRVLLIAAFPSLVFVPCKMLCSYTAFF